MEQILSQSERLVLETASLIKKTGSIFPWKRKSAEKELQARSEELFEPLLILFQKEIVQYRKKSKSVTFSTILLIAISIAFSVIEIGLIASGGSFAESFWLTATLLILVLRLNKP